MMRKIVVSLHDQATQLVFPQSLQNYVEILFGAPSPGPITSPRNVISIRESSPERYAVSSDGMRFAHDNLNTPELLDVLLDRVVHSFIFELNSAVALHAASIGWRGKSVLIAGTTGSGKTSLAGWFLTRDLEFLSDELVVVPDSGRTTLSFPRPLLVKSQTDELLALLALGGRNRTVRTAANTMICRDYPSSAVAQQRQAGLVIFPQFVAGSQLEIAVVPPALAAAKLMECNLNARNLPAHGLPKLAQFGRSVPALALTYGGYRQLDNVLDSLAKFVLENDLTVQGLSKFTSAFSSRPQTAPQIDQNLCDVRAEVGAAPKPSIPVPASTVAPKLTIGMATYDDYDGVYFTVQAIRMYHAEILDDVEFLVIDNNPEGPCAAALTDLANWIPNYRYVPWNEVTGTAVRDQIFKQARGEAVLCLDSHVLVVTGALKRLMDYFDAHPDSRDLLQGPMMYDDRKSLATHFKPEWDKGMLGSWSDVVVAIDPDQPPFEIAMQGLGLFACRREAWPGFNPAFRGFGGEEGYIHEKIRRRGGRALCFPFLQWMHRFERPFGTRYSNVMEDRVRNYLIGFRELGWDTAPVADHFIESLGEEEGKRVVEHAMRNLPPVSAAARPVSRHDLADAKYVPSPRFFSASGAQPRLRKGAPKLTIGMATHDDYDGSYFTLQAIRLYHPEILDDVEFLIIDNNPDGPCGAALKRLENWIPDFRYIPRGEITGTAIRECVFQEARGDFVLCLDCHVMLVCGSLKRLMDYFDTHPASNDLLQGPLLYDGLNTISTHFNPEWRAGMYGTWGVDPLGSDPELPPFEIPMQGLGLFACRRDAWPGFNRDFRGFGGEEGYIHEKIRQRGGRALCLPFLRWLHRFHRPLGTTYPNIWEDRVRNYWIGFRELGLDTAPIAEHFKAYLGNSVGARIVGQVQKEFASAPFTETALAPDGSGVMEAAIDSDGSRPQA